MTKNIKTCSRCGRAKPTHCFSRDQNSPDGLSYECYDCRHARYLANRSKILKRMSGPDFRPNRQVYNSRNRAKNYDVENTLAVPEWKAKLAEYDGCCAYCGKEVGQENLVIDHTLPMVRGGNNSIENVVPACKRCNRKKARKTPEEFLEYLELEKAIRQLPEFRDQGAIAISIRRLK